MCTRRRGSEACGFGARPRIVACLGLVALSSLSAPAFASGYTAYVVSTSYPSGGGIVTPMSTATNTPGPAIGAGLGAGGIAISPDGATAYVTGSSGNSITVISTTTNKDVRTIKGIPDPTGIAITPDGSMAYVGSYADGVVPIALATDTLGTSIPVGVGCEYGTLIAITPDGKTAYVACDNAKGTVTPITLATGTVGTSIPTGIDAGGIAITPDGKTVYASAQNSSTVTPITTATDTGGTPISVGTFPDAIAITPDGNTAYVVNQTTDGSITPITVATNTAGTPIPAGNFPIGIAITPDGRLAYVTNYFYEAVTPIEIEGPPFDLPSISIGNSNPTAIAIAPVPRVVVTSTTLSCLPASVLVGEPTTCTATVSESGSGTPITPMGPAAFSSSKSGKFSAKSCTLLGSGATASCQVSSRRARPRADSRRSPRATAGTPRIPRAAGRRA